MNKFSSVMGLAIVAAAVAAPAQAGSQVPTVPSAGAKSTTVGSRIPRATTVGTQLDTVYVTLGAVDPQGKRFEDSGARIGVLPTISDEAFLDGDDASATPAPL